MQKPIKGLLCLPALFVTACQSIPEHHDRPEINMVDIANSIVCEAKREIFVGEEKKEYYSDFNEYDIAFKFEFTVDQNNTKSGDVDLTFPVGLGTLGIGISQGSIKDTNTNKETFDIAMKVKNLAKVDCMSGHYTITQAGALPIRGNVGLHQALRAFAELDDFSDSKASGFTRKLTFKVVMDLGTKGSVSLERANGEKIVANANASGQRTDTHELTFSIKKPEEPKSDKGKVNIPSLTKTQEPNAALSEIQRLEQIQLLQDIRENLTNPDLQ